MANPKLNLSGFTPEGEQADPDTIGKGPKKPLPRRFQTLDGLLDAHEEHVRAWWKEHGSDASASHRPMIIAVCKNGDIVPVMAMLAFDEAMKDQFADHMRGLLHQWRAERYVFISEAWLAEIDTTKDDPGWEHLPPSQRNDRKEIMMLVAADRKKTKERMLEMVRDWTTGCVTELKADPKRDEAAASMGGRFSTLLQPLDNPLDAEEHQERLTLLETALHLRGAVPERIDDFKRTRDWGRALWAEVEAARKAVESAVTKADMDAACDRFNRATDATRPFFLHLAEGYRRRDREEGKAGMWEDLLKTEKKQ